MKENNLIVFDLETTGLSKQTDRTVQLAAVKIDRNFKILDKFKSYIIPSGQWTMTPGAEVVHGLTREFIEENGKPLAEVAPDFLKFIEGCDYVTFNGNNFDVQILWLDFAREDLELPFEGRKFYDVCGMERVLNPNNLRACFERYTGQTMDAAGLEAHDALSDVLATVAVMRGQFEKYDLNWDKIDDWKENELLTPEGSIRDADGVDGRILLFAFGKYKEKDVYEIMKSDPDYCRWWSQNVATPYTRNIVRKYVTERKEKDGK